MYKITVTSPINQDIKVLIDGREVFSSFLSSGSQSEILIEELDVLNCRHLFIETRDEIIDITDYAKEQVRSELNKPKPIVNYNSISFN